MDDLYISINKVAKAKGLKGNRSLRIAIQKGKYIAREIIVPGGKSYEILYSSLEPEVQRIFGRAESNGVSEPVRCRSDVTPPTPRIIQDEKLEDEEIKCRALVPVNSSPEPSFVSESSRLTALARVDIVMASDNFRSKYPTRKEADSVFLDLYNSGMLLPQVHKFLGSISIGTLHRWVRAFENYGTYKALFAKLQIFSTVRV